MHGELPQELSVTAAEVLGTGTGHAGGWGGKSTSTWLQTGR